jgi:hypothetical protein
MVAGRRMSEEEICPVRDELLGELYHADENRVSDLVATVAPDIRVLLALYCYHSSHLHTRGVAIARSCDQEELVRLGGHVGAFLFARSRETLSPAPRRVSLRHPPSRHAGNWSPSQDVAN